MVELAERKAILERLADAIEERRSELVAAMISCSQRTRRVAQGEVDLAVERLRAFDQVVPWLTGREPMGGVAVVLPSNASLSNPVAALGTAFLAGNQMRARFPTASRRWAREVEPLLARFLPDLTFDHGSGRCFLEGVLADPGMDVVLVFGDDAWALGYEAAVRESGKKMIFEGPGKDPFLVLPGADLERASRDAVRAGFYNAGQACTSPERFYVHASLVAELTERVVELTRAQVVGEPEREEVTVGPIASRRVAERIAAQLDDARNRGARVRVGGGLTDGRLADGTAVTYVEPTVLTGVSSEMAVMQDETFGPLIPIQSVASAEEALELAAASRYGLAANLYGGGDAEAAVLAESHGPVFRDEVWLDYYRRNLHAPYGGRKLSGWVWWTRDGRFARRDGPRTNALEFSREVA